jgi:hypothetical protein
LIPAVSVFGIGLGGTVARLTNMVVSSVEENYFDFLPQHSYAEQPLFFTHPLELSDRFRNRLC